MIRQFKPSDLNPMREIYNHYVENTLLTFDEVALTETEFSDKLSPVLSKFPCMVYEKEGKVMGFAYATEWKKNPAYRFTVSSSIYLDPEAMDKGTGTALYRKLIEELKEMKMHSIVAGILMPNEKSTRMHERLGFSKVAHLSQIGYKFNKWIDVSYWQMIL
jgi:L-amino acid N-acyltransferase YncA